MTPHLLILFIAQPVESVWIRGPASGSVARPDVHSVEVTDRELIVRSAGISLANLGPLAVPPVPREGQRQFTFRIPLQPRKAASRHSHIPLEYGGVFVNGVPIYNQFEAESYQGQNLWHYDLVARSRNREAGTGLLEQLASSERSALIGYALDGYPIYADGRHRSSYRLRAIARRDRWPDGTLLAPGQAGPPVSPEFPLGTFVEDYEYVPGAGDLDQYNGSPSPGTYAYHLSTDPHGHLTFPYLLAHEYYGEYLPAPDLLTPFETIGERLTGRPLLLRLQAPRHLEYVHERPIHLLVVSDDLREFAHLHPEVNERGVWQVKHTFAQPGRYRLYAGYTPPGANSQVAKFEVTIAGASQHIPPATKVDVTLETQALAAGEDVELSFLLGDSVRNLEPYLGAWAHVVIVGAGHSSFQHAHPLDAAGTHAHTAGLAPQRIRVAAVFPTAGRYRLWLQLQIAGNVVTQPFDVEVAPRKSRPISQSIPDHAVRMEITPEGFEPARLQVPPNQPVTLAIRRSGESNCGAKIVFPTLGIERTIALGATELIHLPENPSGEYRFTCGMGMYRGTLVVTSPREPGAGRRYRRP